MSNPATAVFVHGGWHDGWSWHLVRELLDERGVPSIALDLPNGANMQETIIGDYSDYGPQSRPATPPASAVMDLSNLRR